MTHLDVLYTDRMGNYDPFWKFALTHLRLLSKLVFTCLGMMGTMTLSFVRWIDSMGTNDNLVVHCTNMEEINDSFGCSFQWLDGLCWKFCCSLHLYVGDMWEVLFFFSLILWGLISLSLESFIHMLVSNDNCLYLEWYEGEECQFCSYLKLLWWKLIIHLFVICTDTMWLKDKFDVPWTDWWLLMTFASVRLTNLIEKIKFCLFIALIFWELVTQFSVPYIQMTWNNDTIYCSLQRFEVFRCTNMISANDISVPPHTILKGNIYKFGYFLRIYIGNNW